MKKDIPKSWHTCEKCWDKFFPDAKKDFYCITVMEWECPDCWKEATLIPLSDWYWIFD